jgi:hypothetical protein
MLLPAPKPKSKPARAEALRKSRRLIPDAMRTSSFIFFTLYPKAPEYAPVLSFAAE